MIVFYSTINNDYRDGKLIDGMKKFKSDLVKAVHYDIFRSVAMMLFITSRSQEGEVIDYR